MNLEFGFDQPDHGEEDLEDLLYDIADSKLMAFLGYVGLGRSETRFIVYTRGLREESQRVAWVAEVENRFPVLSGRVLAVNVPGGSEAATFRDPETVRMMNDLVRDALEVEE